MSDRDERSATPVAAGAERHGGERLYDTEISTRTMLWLGVGLVALVAISAGIVYLLYLGFSEMERRAQPPAPILAEERAPVRVTGPELLSEPERTRAEVDAEHERRATSYGWVDEEAGIVHIPVERAIEIVAEWGLPTTAGVSAGRVPTGDRVETPDAEEDPGAADVLSVQRPEEAVVEGKRE